MLEAIFLNTSQEKSIINLMPFFVCGLLAMFLGAFAGIYYKNIWFPIPILIGFGSILYNTTLVYKILKFNMVFP